MLYTVRYADLFAFSPPGPENGVPIFAMIERGAEPMLNDDNGNNLLHHFAKGQAKLKDSWPSYRGRVALLQQLLEKYPRCNQLFKMHNREGQLPLHAAITRAMKDDRDYGLTSFYSDRTEENALLDVDSCGSSYLHLLAPELAKHNHLALFVKALELGAGINARDSNGVSSYTFRSRLFIKASRSILLQASLSP